MGFLTIPAKLTEEELTLQQKYQKLKRKKKLLQQYKAPRPEQEPQPTRRAAESGIDPKEVAKKLLKSGKIHAIKSLNLKERQDSGFKRSKAHERKRCTGAEKPGGYLSFSTSHSLDDDSEDLRDPKKKPIYESFVASRDPHSLAREETFKEKKRDGKANYVNRDNPQQSNTIFVHGESITEDILRLGFSTFGAILHISAEPSKNCGFVTYESIDIANKAINEMNGKSLAGIKLKVSLARRQPLYNASKAKQSSTELDSSLSAPEAWSVIASNFTDSSESDKKRVAVAYDDDDIFETI